MFLEDLFLAVLGLSCLGFGTTVLVGLITNPWIPRGFFEVVVAVILQVLAVVLSFVVILIGMGFLWGAVTNSVKTAKTV